MQQPKMTTAASTLAVVLLAAGSCAGDPLVAAPPATRAAPVATAQALPPGHPPASAADAVPPVPQGAGVGSNGLTWAVPPGWKGETPSSSMRRAQYRVPGAAGDAECVVFYFGPGQGGDAASNAKRWAGQFRQPDGRDPAAAMKTSEIEVGALKVTLVEVKGTYSGGMGGAAGERPRLPAARRDRRGPRCQLVLQAHRPPGHRDGREGGVRGPGPLPEEGLLDR